MFFLRGLSSWTKIWKSCEGKKCTESSSRGKVHTLHVQLQCYSHLEITAPVQSNPYPFPLLTQRSLTRKPDYSDITVTLETVQLSLTGTSGCRRENQAIPDRGTRTERVWLAVLRREYEAAPYLHCSHCSAAGFQSRVSPTHPISPVRTCTCTADPSLISAPLLLSGVSLLHCLKSNLMESHALFWIYFIAVLC